MTDASPSQEQYILARIDSARTHLRDAATIAERMPAFWDSDFYPIALAVGKAATESLSALVNITDLASKEDEYIIEQFWQAKENDIAALAEMLLQKVTHTCEDPDCAH